MRLCRTEKEFELTALRFKAVAHPHRLAILCLLANGKYCVSQIADILGISQPNISHHLLLLHNLKLLTWRKEANRVFYSIGDARLAELISLLRQIYCP